MSCGPIIVYPPCAPSCPDVPALTFQNDNLTGEGVFHEKVGTTVGFFGISNTDGTIVISLDAPNNAISIDLNAELVAGSFPDATTTSKGKVELSTDGEALAKTSTAVVLTPSNLAALGGTTSFAGLLELATDAEAEAGTDTTRAVTPRGARIAMGSPIQMGLSNGTTIDTFLLLVGSKFEITAGSGIYRFNSSGLRIEGAPLDLATGGDLNLNGAKLKFAGSNMTASSVLGTTGSAGVATSYPLTNFLRFGEAQAGSGSTVVDTSGGNFTFSQALGSILLNDTGYFISSIPVTITSESLTLTSCRLNLGTGSDLNFTATSRIQVAGIDVDADSFIRTDSGGAVTSELCALYFGPTTTTNTWFCPAFVADRDIDPATCTLTELATAFNTLLSDLADVKKPVVSIV